jgi:hypothetical protein
MFHSHFGAKWQFDTNCPSDPPHRRVRAIRRASDRSSTLFPKSKKLEESNLHHMAQPFPLRELDTREAIRFLHPGYSISNTLLSFPCVDRMEGSTTFGVYYRTALLTYQIIAGNTFDNGRLTLNQAGQRPVNLQLNDILTKEVYYLILSEVPGMNSTSYYLQ